MRIIWSSFNFSIDVVSFVKLLASAILTFFISQILVNRMRFNPWIEILLGGAFSFLLYFIMVILLRVLDDTDIGYLCNISDSLGPLSVPLNFILEIIRKFIYLSRRN
jgi:hypothetical protein